MGLLHPQKDRAHRTKRRAYMVPEGGVLDGVLSSQGDAAEQDEEEDEVGEDRVIDNAVALQAEPAWERGREGCVRKDGVPLGPQESVPSVLIHKQDHFSTA